MVMRATREAGPRTAPVKSKHTPSSIMGGTENGPQETLLEAALKWNGMVPTGRINWFRMNWMFTGVVAHRPR